MKDHVFKLFTSLIKQLTVRERIHIFDFSAHYIQIFYCKTIRLYQLCKFLTFLQILRTVYAIISFLHIGGGCIYIHNWFYNGLHRLYIMYQQRKKNMKGLTLTIKVWCCPRSIHTKCHGLMGTSGVTART